MNTAGPLWRPFSFQEVAWGLEYIKNETGRNRDHLALPLQMFANKIRARMAKDSLTFEQIHRTEIEVEYRTFFRRAADPAALELEMNDIIDAVGKMFNNRKNCHRPGFTPTRRKSPKRTKTKVPVIAKESGQLAWDFGSSHIK